MAAVGEAADLAALDGSDITLIVGGRMMARGEMGLGEFLAFHLYSLMLMWPMDIIIAADNAKFTDPVVAFGVNAVEYCAHPWEMGPRKAKEMLFTGEVMTAEEAKEWGHIDEILETRPKPEGEE